MGQLCSTGAAPGQVLSDKMPPVLWRRDSLTGSCLRYPMSRWALKNRAQLQVKRSKTIIGLEICVLEAQDDVYDETPRTPTNLAETSGENATDDDIVAPEVTEKLNRLKTLGRIYIAPSVDQLRPLMYVYSQRTNDPLDDRMVAESRKRETGLRLGTLEALRMIVSLAATRDGKHRPRSRAFYDIVAAFVHASIDEVVGVVPPEGMLERGECFLLLMALYCARMASKRWQRHCMRVLKKHGWSSSKVMAWILSPPRPCWNVRV